MPEIHRYWTKRVAIEAVEYDGSKGAMEYVAQWTSESKTKAQINKGCRLAENGKLIVLRDGNPNCAVLSINTLEGTMYVTPGDFVIRGLRGEFYPCKPDVFRAKYEVEDDALASHLLPTRAPEQPAHVGEALPE